MRKVNKIMMIAVSILLCSVLITSCVLSGTLAKYTSVGRSSASARVAKWGVNIDISSGDLPGGIQGAWNGDAFEFGSSDALRMSPGREYPQAIHIKFSGSAEVKLKVKIMVGISFDENLKVPKNIGGVTEDTYFIPMGFTFGAKNTESDTTIIEPDYVSEPWRHGTDADQMKNPNERVIAENVAKKIDTLSEVKGTTNGSDANYYIEKIFEPNQPIVFHPLKADSLPDTDVIIDQFDIGFRWPSSYTDATTNFNYSEIANYMIENLSAYTFAVRYTVTIEQVK
ncbi:MAG: hypothetical protein E7678_02530 [Ruminococcaceae bacterium]|nr:hypothetical protein [Oscillospiraceae bacterium]